MDDSGLPDALVEALAGIIADERKTWSRERDHIQAEARAEIAELRAQLAEITGLLRDRADAQLRRIDEALATIKDGAPGPAGPPGRDADEDAIVELVLARVPMPEPGPPGRDGREVDLDMIRAFIAEEVQQLPPPAAGPPGPAGDSGDPTTLLPALQRMVQDAVSAIEPAPGPAGPPGPAGDPAELTPVIAGMVEDAFGRLPVPLRGEKGEPGDPETLLPTIERMIDDAVAAKPMPEPVPGPRGEPGQPGRDADPADVLPLVLAQLPPPERGAPGRDGRSITDLRRIGEQIVIAMSDGAILSFDGIQGPPGPKGDPGCDGRDVPEAVVQGMVERLLARAVAQLPPPEKGEKGDKGDAGERGDDVDLDTVAVMIEDSVRSTLEGWPRPTDGKDGRGIEMLKLTAEGDLLAYWTDAAVDHIGCIRGPQGLPGEPGPQGDKGDQGDPGRDAEIDQALIQTMIEQLVAEIPAPQDGAPGPAGPPGPAGKDADPLMVEHLVGAKVADAIARIPPPEKGDPGAPGAPGRGIEWVDVTPDGAFLVKYTNDAEPREVASIVGPPGEKGDPGETGAPGRDGCDGVDADMDLVARWLDERIAALPAPKDGAPGRDGKDGRGVSAIRKAGNDLLLVMSDGAVETVPDVIGPPGAKGEPGEKGAPGQDGADADVDYARIEASIQQLFAELPRPKDGAPGRGIDALFIDDGHLLIKLSDEETTRDLGEIRGLPGPKGEDADLDLVARWIDERFAQIPIPKDGEPGRDGKDAAVDYQLLLDELLPFAKTEVSEQIAALPPPEPGPVGPPGPRGEPGEKGEPGQPGQDGAGIAGALIDRENRLLLTLSDGTVRDLGMVVGRDGKDGQPGKDGRDGADGIGFDDLEFVQENARLAVLRFRRGDQVKEWPVLLAGVEYQGIWKADAEYLAGDLATHAGSLWCAKTRTIGERPGDGATSWQLCAKAGRPGKDGRSAYQIAVERGFQGTEDEWLKSLRGPEGRPGRDLTHLHPVGE